MSDPMLHGDYKVCWEGPEEGFWAPVKPPKPKHGDFVLTKISTPFEVIGITSNLQGEGNGRFVRVKGPKGSRYLIIPISEILKGMDALARLSEHGLNIFDLKNKQCVIDYLNSFEHLDTVDITNSIGWYEESFVLPDRTINPAGSSKSVYFSQEFLIQSSFDTGGDLSEYITGICRRLGDNSKFVFSISLALSGPLLHLLNGESGGIHFFGPSSIGKTTLLDVAASVWGQPKKFKKQWRLTDNALEYLCAQHSDTFLCLDEMGQLDPETIGKISYMIGNGKGKARAHKTGGAREPQSWRLSFISTGEVGLTGNTKSRAMTGQELRLIEIPADSNTGFGVFNTVSGFTNSKEFVDYLANGVNVNYGVLGEAWLYWVVENRDEVIQGFKVFSSFMKEILEYHLIPSQAKRVADRFIIIAYAGYLADLSFNLFAPEFNRETVTRAVKRCFSAWLENFGSQDSKEEEKILNHAKSQLEKNENSRFEVLDTVRADPDDLGSSYPASIQNKLGFRQQNVFYVLASQWEEFCSPFNSRHVSEVLRKVGLLGEATQKKVRGLNRRVYTLSLPND